MKVACLFLLSLATISLAQYAEFDALVEVKHADPKCLFLCSKVWDAEAPPGAETEGVKQSCSTVCGDKELNRNANRKSAVCGRFCEEKCKSEKECSAVTSKCFYNCRVPQLAPIRTRLVSISVTGADVKVVIPFGLNQGVDKDWEAAILDSTGGIKYVVKLDAVRGRTLKGTIAKATVDSVKPYQNNVSLFPPRWRVAGGIRSTRTVKVEQKVGCKFMCKKYSNAVGFVRTTQGSDCGSVCGVPTKPWQRAAVCTQSCTESCIHAADGASQKCERKVCKNDCRVPLLTTTKSRVIAVAVVNGKTEATIALGEDHGVASDWTAVFVRKSGIIMGKYAIKTLKPTVSIVVTDQTLDSIRDADSVVMVPAVWRGGDVDKAVKQFYNEHDTFDNEKYFGFRPSRHDRKRLYEQHLRDHEFDASNLIESAQGAEVFSDERANDW